MRSFPQQNLIFFLSPSLDGMRWRHRLLRPQEALHALVDHGVAQAPQTQVACHGLVEALAGAAVAAVLHADRGRGAQLVHGAAEFRDVADVSRLERQAGEITVRPIHSYPGAEAKRVLVSARKGLRSGPMRLLEPRYLYREKGGTRTDWALAMQRDGAGMDWN